MLLIEEEVMLDDEHHEVTFPSSFQCSNNDIEGLLDHIYPTIDIVHPDGYFEKCCILAPSEGEAGQINQLMLEWFLGDLYKFNSTIRGLLNWNRQGQLPYGTAFLSPELGCPVILLHTGCRGVISELGGPCLSIQLFSGQVATVQRTPMATMRGILLLLFPVKLAFVMAIEDARGQAFTTLGIDLWNPFLPHHQLIMALHWNKPHGSQIHWGHQ